MFDFPDAQDGSQISSSAFHPKVLAALTKPIRDQLLELTVNGYCKLYIGNFSFSFLKVLATTMTIVRKIIRAEKKFIEKIIVHHL